MEKKITQILILILVFMSILASGCSSEGKIRKYTEKREAQPVVDSNLKLTGVLTDGDLRRGLEKWGDEFFSLKAEDAMTFNSKTVTTKILAAKALAIMEKYSITCLVVSDDGEKVNGVIHLHDLLKAGIV